MGSQGCPGGAFEHSFARRGLEPAGFSDGFAAIGPNRPQKASIPKETVVDVVSPTLINLIIFVLAIYVGYHVVWTVTPALHTPLMAVTNAISAIIIVGTMLAAGLTEGLLAQVMGTVAVSLAAVNVFGGFLVTQRMLEMFKKKEPKAVKADGNKEGK